MHKIASDMNKAKHESFFVFTKGWGIDVSASWQVAGRYPDLAFSPWSAWSLEKLQHCMQIAAHWDGEVVSREQFSLQMEVYRTEFTSLGSWQMCMVIQSVCFHSDWWFSWFIAGAGKSILWYDLLAIFLSWWLIVLPSASIIKDVDDMQKLGLTSLAFFYCDFREDQKKGLCGLLSSFLVQLCHQSDSYSDVLSDLYMEHSNGSRQPSDNALIECLKEILKLPEHAPIYLIIDAGRMPNHIIRFIPSW